jgi:CRISPR-associated protein Cas1
MTATALNVLYVLQDGAYLSKDHDTIVVRAEGERKAQVPFCQLEGVVVLGGAGFSPDLLGGLVNAGVFISFFNRAGRLLARVDGLPGGNVLLRKAQVRASDNSKQTLDIARSIVVGKLASSRNHVVRSAREQRSIEEVQLLDAAAERMLVMNRRALAAEGLDELRGIEGMGAREYFGIFSLFLKADEPGMTVSGRTRRPPGDPVNALLSFGYALLLRDCAAALAGVGLDPAIGFLHEDRPGRLGLALDLMEEFRCPVVDRLALALLNRGQLTMQHFRQRDGAGWETTDDGRRLFIGAYQRAKQSPIRHQFLEQDTTWGMAPHLQARLLARTIRGDVESYPPFELR